MSGTLYEPRDTSGNRTEASRFSHWYLSTDTTESAFDFTTPITSHITLKGKWNDLGLYTISYADPQNIFIHEDDRAALNALENIPGFSQVMKLFMKSWNEKIMHINIHTAFWQLL